MEKRARFNLNKNSLINYAAIGLIAATFIGQQISSRSTGRATSQDSPQVVPDSPQFVATAEAPIAPSSPKQVKLLKLNLSLSAPADLKIKEGDTVAAGQVLANRVEEQASLTAQRQELSLQYQQLKSKTIPTPPAPVPVPALEQLPPVSYAEEEAAIAVARMNVRQTEQAFQLQQQKVKQAPLEESNAVEQAQVEVENQQRLVENQQRTLDAVALLKDLPESVTLHEQEVLKQKQADLNQAEANYKQAQVKLSAASQAETEKLSSIGSALEKARVDQQLAIAKLQTKRDQTAYTHYEASITAARRAEERNQSIQNYSQQLQEAEQRQRDHSFQLAQLKAKIAEVDNALRTVSIVTSPYSGLIRSIKIQKQTDNKLSAELILAVSGNPPATRPGSGTLTLTPSQPSTSPTPITN